MEVEPSDPRIDSPEIKVVYPAMQTEDFEKTASTVSLDPVEDKPQTVSPTIDPPHTCTVSFQDAIRQHLFPLIGASVMLLIVGYLIGKK